ncbi:MAG TPA: antibiotic biosynthesis monooxygenase [Saprospiraceae bacterium]|nr:antibiotic biosynthesis monooxygenase [Saprospiraceae bacterium]
MIAVIFEAHPNEGKWDDYMQLAQNLRPFLEKIEGFISIERFQSTISPEKVLSLSFWENEESVHAWRNVELHRMAQEKGKQEIFSNYRIRVAHVKRDYSMENRVDAPEDSKSILDQIKQKL